VTQINPVTGVLALRCDASPQIGTGHVMRCIGLAQAWQERGGTPIFILAGDNSGVRSRLEAEGFALHILSVTPAATDDIRRTISVSRELGARWLMLDGYQFGAEYQLAIREAGIRLALITDYIHAARFYAEVLVNPLADASYSEYAKIAPEAVLLLGSKYVLLRHEFRVAKQTLVHEPQSRQVLISFGGADPVNMTSRAVRALAARSWPGVEFVVLSGMNCPFRGIIEQETAQAGSAFSVVYNTSDMAGLLRKSVMALCSASATCWEAAFMGVPVLMMILADNQEALAASVETMKAGASLGWHDRVSDEAIVRAVDGLLQDGSRRLAMSKVGRQLIDGNGVHRVIDVLNGLSAQ
jgi:UDP-2,4-diacetamido-2,4,6-trideoxy-beta-L-altropyranose hydrolase